MFFDFHIHGNPKLALEAEKMGYQGVALVLSSRDSNSNNSKRNSSKKSQRPSSNGSIASSSNDLKNQVEILKDLKKTCQQFEEDKHFSIQIGVEILAKNPNDLKKQVQKFRKKSDIILVHGGDLKINRTATEDPRVDILCHPYRGRYDAGINHVLSAKATENQVAVELNLKYYLLTRPSQRFRVLSQFRSIVKLHRKYKFPVIINSGAGSLYDLRNPQDIIALSKCFGMTKIEAFKALSTIPQEIMNRNIIRDQVVIQGVRLIN